MNEIKKENSDVIDLIEIFSIIWKNKITVFLFSAVSVVIMLIYQSSITDTFNVKTEIRPISTFEEYEYDSYNAFLNIVKLNYFDQADESILEALDDAMQNNNIKKETKQDILSFRNIDKIFLLNLFTEKINDREFLNKVIKKTNFIERKDYSDDIAYENAIANFASSIKINLKPSTSNLDDNKSKDVVNYFISASIKSNSTKGWENLIQNIETFANKEIKEYTQKYFKNLILNSKKIIEYRIEDVDMMIENTLRKYDENIINRLVFLSEQAQIARKLNVAKNNLIEAQTFTTDTGIIANLRTDIPYYMRGYEMIEKEIELIQARTKRRAFAEGLSELEFKKRKLINNKDVERLENLFNQTPLVKSDEFSAAYIMFASTSYQSNKGSTKKMLIITGIFGLILGILFAIIRTFVIKSN